jgi:hypothetical protein
LEKLEEYRERKLQDEMFALEMERQKEEEELKSAYMKELKHAKYLEDQREKLAMHREIKQQEE